MPGTLADCDWAFCYLFMIRLDRIEMLYFIAAGDKSKIRVILIYAKCYVAVTVSRFASNFMARSIEWCARRPRVNYRRSQASLLRANRMNWLARKMEENVHCYSCSSAFATNVELFGCRHPAKVVNCIIGMTLSAKELVPRNSRPGEYNPPDHVRWLALFDQWINCLGAHKSQIGDRLAVDRWQQPQ